MIAVKGMAVGFISFISHFQQGLLIRFCTLILAFVILVPTFCYSYDSILDSWPTCKAYCEKHRPNGWRGEFQFDCDIVYNSNDDKQYYQDAFNQYYCRKECENCPDIVCRNHLPNKFHCPATDIEGQCKNRCDSNREKGNFDGYKLDCDQVYHDPLDIQSCQNDCGSCPTWVCDPKEDKSLYNCPTADYDGRCKHDCEHHRHYTFSDTKDKFTYYCSRFINEGQAAVDDCTKACDKCPRWLCDKNTNPDEWNCPAQVGPTPLPTPAPPTQRQRKYEGWCKDFCEKYRKGGTDKYTLRCKDPYNTQDEAIICEYECRQCSSDVCEDKQFECPAADRHVDYKTAFIVCLVIAIILLVTFISLVIYCLTLRNRGMYATTAVVAQVPLQVQQSNYQMAGYAASPQVSAPVQYQPIQ